MPSLFQRTKAAIPQQPGFSGLFNRAMGFATHLTHMKSVNKWRDAWNPLRALTLPRAISQLEDGERGAFADLQWLYRYIEMSDPTLVALLARYDGGLVKLDWQIKVTPEDEWPEGASQALADQQAAALRELYDGIDNLREAIQFLVLARFRGFSHLEKHVSTDGDILHLEPVPQWHWVRDGLNGEWQYNKDAKSGATKGDAVNPEQFIIREVQRPVNRIALLQFVFRNLGLKDWAGFVETYGIPPLFIVGPPNVPSGQEAAYQEVAERIIGDARGYLPHGSEAKTLESGGRGTNPFRDFMSFLKEELVLAATGGKLTMLAESGSGTLAGSAHQEAWDEIIETEAMLISELFQQSLDKPRLAQKFGEEKPQLAYFELCAYDEDEPSEVVEQVAKLSSAGFDVDPDQVAEKTGYKVTKKEPVQPNVELGTGNAEQEKEAVLRNRSLTHSPTHPLTAAAAALQEDLTPVLALLEVIADQPALVEKFLNSRPQIQRAIAHSQALRRYLTPELEKQFAEGVKTK